MTAIVTSRDVQEILSKLSSDKAKAREEGIKLLNSWLEGERSITFCKFLGKNTAELKPNDICHSETWPFLITLLMQCASKEISSSKRRLPKLIFAKTLRMVVQRAQDSKFTGEMLPLLSVVRQLFNHIWDVLRDVPSFQSEYGVVLRHLLTVNDYRFHIRKRVYSNLVLLYMDKVESSLGDKNDNPYIPREEVVRCILTLQSLLENPPGDFVNSLREDVVKGFVRIFSYVRDEDKLSRKLIECINKYLLKDGPNLGHHSMEIHGAVQQFVFHCWLTTHDRALKDALILYSRLQINLTRGATDGNFLVEQLLDIVCKELDQSFTSGGSLPRVDASKDEKFGALSSFQYGLVDLAAAVLYRACVNMAKPPSSEKRMRKEHAAARLREALTKGKWLWNAAFCCLTRNYHMRISEDLFIYWFEGISASFERIMNDANMGHTYEGLLWTLRSLQELTSVLLLPNSKVETSSRSSALNEYHHNWRLLWSCLMHGLPIFSNITAVVDATLILLSDMISSDLALINTFVVPQDVWDLSFFKQAPSVSVLYFISCYFSMKGSQGDVRDILHLRKSLLKVVLAHSNRQESSMFNEHLVLLLPAAIYSLSTGSAPFKQCHRRLPPSYASEDVNGAMNDWVKAEEIEQDYVHELFDCSIEVLANIDLDSSLKVSSSPSQINVRLPRQLRDPLLLEMETLVLANLVDNDTEARPLSDLLFLCALLSNLVYGSYFVRQGEGFSSFPSKLGQRLLELLDHAVDAIQRNQNDLSSGCLSYDFVVGDRALVTSFRSFVSSPLFVGPKDRSCMDLPLYDAVTQSMERLLKELAKGYEEYCKSSSSLQSRKTLQDLSASVTPVHNTCPFDSNKSTIMDLELDVNDDAGDVDTLNVGGKLSSGLSSSVKWKFNMISLISGFFSVLHVVTWDILFELMDKECDSKVRETILYNLCQHPYWSSSSNFTDLINLMHGMIEIRSSLKLDCVSTLAAIYALLEILLSLKDNRKAKLVFFSLDMKSEKSLMHLGDLVNKIAELDHLEWSARVKLVDCICDFVLLSPQIGQTMIERLLLMLRDTDYRVRFSVARRIGVLFETWEGHEELFQDICSNFGVKLVVCSKGKIVTASEVLASGPQSCPMMETILVTLMHLALYSEKIEEQAVFMICVISAIDPSQRELVFMVLDNLSRKLQYTTRFKYLEELIGAVLFSWVACGVSLAALVETRQLFVTDSEPTYFMLYCCNWLLPTLVLHGDICNLSWVSKIAGQPLSALLKDHFVQIFSICIGLHCSNTSGGDKGAAVLQNSILKLAQISESERDALIKKHMVSIVSHILSLASCASEPTVPFFSLDTVERAIRTVVDGFLEPVDYPTRDGVADKINIFRPDRVFMFILEVHYKIAAAVHYRHKCHRLAGIEVLIDVLGHRVSVASTFNYLLNLIGQYISCDALQDQCCRIISRLLKVFKSNPTKEMISVLGEQIQLLVSKLVACCSPSRAYGEQSGTGSSQVFSLLLQLTVDCDPSLHDYISELEPFPEIDTFDKVRRFLRDICRKYSTRDHLLKLAKRSCHVPPRLLLSSLQALHKKLLSEENFWIEKDKDDLTKGGGWNFDNEVVNAIWTLVRMCGSDDGNTAGALVSDFISKVGIDDPYSVVFQLPGSYGDLGACRTNNHDLTLENTGMSEGVLIALLKLLMKYLMDDSVKIVDMTSQALWAILSTERGQKTLQSFDLHKRSLVEVHSKGFNPELVEKFLSDLERKYKAEEMSLDDSTLWETHDKNFETWICPLAYVLCGYCNDVILRLCQEVVLSKAEVAELLLPSIFVDLAGRRNIDINLQQLISSKVQEHIFAESNKLIKSIQVFLHALNELRLCYVMERSSAPSKQESSKSSSYGSKSRSTSGKVRDSAATVKAMTMSTSSWNKVYWLTTDYLVVANSAVTCGSYFTAVIYAEHWCEEHFKSLTLGSPDFSDIEMLPHHIEILVSAITHINEPDSLYGIIQSHKLTSQIITYEHEGNWGKALESYDLQVRSAASIQMDFGSQNSLMEQTQPTDDIAISALQDQMRKPFKGLVRSLQQIGCIHVLDLYCQGLASRKVHIQHDLEFTELQYEAAWRAGNWDFSFLYVGDNSQNLQTRGGRYNEHLHSCLRALQEGDFDVFHIKLRESKQELVSSVSHASEESTEHIYSSVIKLQILYHLGVAWDLRWITSSREGIKLYSNKQKEVSGPVIPTVDQLSWLNRDWSSILKRARLHMNFLEPFIAFRRVLLQILSCKDSTMQHLLQSASTLRKGSRFSQAAEFLHEHKRLSVESGEQGSSLYWLGRLEEAKLLRSQGQHEMAISLAKYISQNYQSNEESSVVYRLVGKWLAETRSSNSRTILEKYLKPAVSLAENERTTNKKSIERQGQAHFHLAHYADALFRSYEERLTSSEWHAATRLRKHKTKELEALTKQLKTSKGDKMDYSIKIQELQKQLAMDREEAEKLQDDRDNFLNLALEGYKRCLVVSDKYDVKVMFRLVSLWFSLSDRQDIVTNMLATSNEVQSFKFIPLVYQIASRMGSSKDSLGSQSFQFALVSLLKKMAIDHPYHTIFQLLALANGDRIKDKQRSRNSFVVDLDKKLAAENLLEELSAYHGPTIGQMKQMVEIYIRLAELETRREDTSKRVMLPRDLRNLRPLELVPVVTATFPVDCSCQYHDGSFPYFEGLGDSVLVMNGINAPKVVECLGSDGHIYKQLAKSGNDDLRQDAVMEQFFGLVNTFLQNHRDTWKRRLCVRTYKVVPFTPSAGVLEWVNGTLPLGEYLIGSTRNGGAHGRYGTGDWSFLRCREHMANVKDKRKAFHEVCENFRPVMHHFFLERFLQPADWFEKRLAYTRSVAASSMVGYIVGLGDRHSMNILIDQATAEVVHIDLGVAFEQGLMLKTPERVPFRLTRDIIDGMGVTGVEGVFRKSCEETLSVMRTNKEALLTIVEVFIHDPLYKWALSPLKALQRQKETDDDLATSLEGSQDDYEGNKDAARALMRVKQKLDGYEEGEMRSVHGQVQQLIQDAIDPERLCQMFPGWGPWL